jgi:HEAT repeat protein
MLLWTVLMVSIGVLATLMVITASANPPNAAEMRLQGLVNELREDRLTAERHSAQRELEAAGDAAVPALTVALRSTDSTMRRNAADMLGFIASPSSIGALENALKDDPVPSVRRNAAWALGNISGLSALGELERATVLDSSAIVRQTALDSVARVRSRLALSPGLTNEI